MHADVGIRIPADRRALLVLLPKNEIRTRTNWECPWVHGTRFFLQKVFYDIEMSEWILMESGRRKCACALESGETGLASAGSIRAVFIFFYDVQYNYIEK